MFVLPEAKLVMMPFDASRIGGAATCARRARLVCAAVLAAALTSAAGAQTLGHGQAPDIDYLRVVMALLLTLVIGGAVLWWLRRRLPAARMVGRSATLKVVESARLHPRASLYVVEFDDKRILLAADQNGVIRLAESQSAALPMPAPSQGEAP